MHNIETSNMLLPVHNDTRPTHITSTRDHYDVPGIKFDEVCDLALLKVVLDCVVDFDRRVRVTDRTAVVRDDVRNTFRSYCYFAHFEELVGSFFRCDTVDCKTALDVVKQAEVLARLFDADDICSFIFSFG
jgi:hypothetical protein